MRGNAVRSIKLRVPPRPVLVDTYHKIWVDRLIGREFIIDPTWVPRDNLDQSPPLHRTDDIVYTVKKISKSMSSVWFDYGEDDCRCVPIQHIELIPSRHEIPPSDSGFNTLLSAWAEVWQDWIDATDRVEHLERCQKLRVDELCEAIDEIQKLRKALILNSQESHLIISDKNHEIAYLKRTPPNRVKSVAHKCFVVLTSDISDHEVASAITALIASAIMIVLFFSYA